MTYLCHHKSNYLEVSYVNCICFIKKQNENAEWKMCALFRTNKDGNSRNKDGKWREHFMENEQKLKADNHLRKHDKK